MSVRSFVVGLLLAASGAATTHAGPAPGDGALRPPTGKPRRPVGIEALTVRPGATPFNKEDVSAYIKEHNVPTNLAPATQVQVVSLEFLTVAELTRRIPGDATGFKDGDVIGLATLSGALVFRGPRGTTPAEFSQGYVVFDAGTGNLLRVGTLAP
jgi:hypothetical protein